MLKHKKVFLTGSAGFIGRNIIDQLSQNFEILHPGHAELDLLNREAVSQFLKLNKFDVVIHAANVGGKRSDVPGKLDLFETNKQMFLNLAENKHYFGRMIFLGSGAEYGKQTAVVMAKEADFGKVLPVDEYGKAKVFASEYILNHEGFLNLRCFGIFGKYEDYKVRIVSNAICRALFGLPIVLNQNVKFDFLYVNDLVRIIEHFILNEPKERAYNASSGDPVEILELAEMVKEATGGITEIKVKNQGKGKEYTCNADLLKKSLGDFKFTPHKKAIEEMVIWYKENLHNVKKEDLGFDE
jgi:GDP-L-fucose synthase